jgi:hypothetical protein
MDTFKDRQGLEEAYSKGNPPWQIWREESKSPKLATVSA